MDLLTPSLRFALTANALAQVEAQRLGRPEPDPSPVVKLFNPLGAATWLATELDADGDTLFGLADLGFGCPELGSFSLSEIAALRLPYGLTIERDGHFVSAAPLSLWTSTAQATGSLSAAEAALAARRTPPPVPPAADPAGVLGELPSSGSDDG
ncbi:DUF2958 domain-containing protein [Sphingomonas sp. 1P08PE]|uniref:DUF2958 domain-containing protein n=1 Tax=Sphingomonas sp. 1P08PE TaxID=554122 RepID=UPI00399F4950